ncbi:hypothetical protein [Emticicia sp. C21]|uniref:hypothetical protein n=1 Tax=Emticicia sp. C21 TaxID=2302915 RepID=UPI0013141562|nr:hypothetical protein [Emticicia sp. C21]
MATLKNKHNEETKPVSYPGHGNRNMDSKNPNTGSAEHTSKLPNSDNAKQKNQ